LAVKFSRLAAVMLALKCSPATADAGRPTETIATSAAQAKPADNNKNRIAFRMQPFCSQWLKIERNVHERAEAEHEQAVARVEKAHR